MTLDLPLYRCATVRAIDTAAIAGGTPAFELMRRAGAAAFECLRRHWPRARRVLVLCGPGNNGGDGYVLARLARLAGLEVTVFAIDGRPPASAEARQALAGWQDVGAMRSFTADSELADADLLVDAIFGIGCERPPSGAAAAAITAINRHPAPVLALDVPSGVDADRGVAPGVAVEAALTISFIAAKRGLFTGAGRACSGARELAALGVVAEEWVADGWTERGGELAAKLPQRRADAHKGQRGHVLALGGGVGMGGAIRLCGEAALRCGAGLVSVLTHASHASAALAARPELMVLGLDELADWPAAVAARADVLALGPGLGRDAWARRLAAQALACRWRAAVLDADALNLLADDELRLPPGLPRVLTPHPAEAARLLGCSTAEVQADRFAAATALAERFAAVVVLKGAGSLVATPGQPWRVIDGGNAGLATAGSGDVLTGVIAALLAQGLMPFDAARLGAWLHARAGDLAAQEGQCGLLAADLFGALRRLVNP